MKCECGRKANKVTKLYPIEHSKRKWWRIFRPKYDLPYHIEPVCEYCYREYSLGMVTLLCENCGGELIMTYDQQGTLPPCACPYCLNKHTLAHHSVFDQSKVIKTPQQVVKEVGE